MTAGVIQSHSARDFLSIPVRGFVNETVTSDPGSPTNGQQWHRSDQGQAYIRLGGATVKLGVTAGSIVNADVSATAAIAETKLNLASDAAAGTASRRTLGFSGNAAMPGTARLDQIAAPTAAVGFGGQRATNLADPTGSTDAATQQYVLAQLDLRVNGQDWKASVRAATTANGTLATAFANGQVIDGVTLATGDRILLKNQTTAADNGIYTVNASGAPTRATDADASAEVTPGMTVPVEEGTTNADTIWLLTTNAAITLGTTALAFTQIGASGSTYTAGTGLTLTGNQFSLTAPVTVALGGTNATTAAGARTSLNTPQQGFNGTTGAVTGGTDLATAHGLGTAALNVEVTITSTGEHVDVWYKVDATNVTINVATSQSAGFYTITAIPKS
jgi:hypothetical protein